MTALILHGALPNDPGRDDLDTLEEVESVTDALHRLGWETVEYAATLDLTDLVLVLDRTAPQVVVNLVEILGGSGRLIHLPAAVIGARGFPYTGASAEALSVTTDKLLAKRIMSAAGIPTPACVVAGIVPNDGVSSRRWVIKSLYEHASLGMDGDTVVAVASPIELEEKLDTKLARHGGAWFAEEYIEGREFNISVLDGSHGPEVLPPAEIRFLDFPPDKPKIVDYRAKWEEDSFEYTHTVRAFDTLVDNHTLEAHLRDTSLACWRLFGLTGYARVDFRVDADGTPWVLEVNANPCISPNAGFIAAAARVGLSYDATVERIVRASHPAGV